MPVLTLGVTGSSVTDEVVVEEKTVSITNLSTSELGPVVGLTGVTVPDGRNVPSATDIHNLDGWVYPSDTTIPFKDFGREVRG